MDVKGSMPSLAREIAAAMEHLERVTVAHGMARDATATATRNETTCLNAVNSAQKKLDELMATVRKQATVGTDWQRLQQTRQGERIA